MNGQDLHPDSDVTRRVAETEGPCCTETAMHLLITFAGIRIKLKYRAQVSASEAKTVVGASGNMMKYQGQGLTMTEGRLYV
jgi:hypothetical protein